MKKESTDFCGWRVSYCALRCYRLIMLWRRSPWKFLRMACLLLCLMLLSPDYAMAAQPLEVSVEESHVENGKLRVYVNSSLEREEQPLTGENFQISLGGSDIPCEDVCYFSDTGEPVAYIYLVDVSGSISAEKLQKMKDFLKSVTQNLGEQDKVCLITFGDRLSIGEFTDDKKALEQQIDQIEGLGEDTNLYQGIVDSLKLLETGEHGADKKVLLILSDGEDDQAAGITREEVDDCLKEIRVPVYTAAMLDENASEEQQEFAKILGSFARQSAGGFHTMFQGEEISVEEGAAKIISSIADGLVLSGDLSKYQVGNGQAYLQITLNVKGLGQASDGCMVSEHSLGMEEKKADEGKEDEDTQNGVQEDVPKDAKDGDVQSDAKDGEDEEDVKDEGVRNEEKNGNIIIWISAAAAVAVCLVLVLFLLIRRKKTVQQKTDEESKEAKQEENEYQEMVQTSEQEVSKDLKPREKKNSDEEESLKEHEDMEENRREELQKFHEDRKEYESGEEKESFPEQVIWMTKIGLLEEATFEIRFQKEVTLGRQSKKADYAFPEDLLISAIHCSITSIDGDLVLCDKGSKNGTFVNGIPITAPYVLKCDDVIHMGRTDFRVYW